MIADGGVKMAKEALTAGLFIQEVTKKSLQHSCIAPGKPPASTCFVPDGTVAWLNAASSITCPTTFARQGKGEVTIEGEAYFEVSPGMKENLLLCKPASAV